MLGRAAMRRDVIIADDFYKDPDSIVDYAKSLEYIYPYNRGANASDRVLWRTSRYLPAEECPFKSSEAFIQRLEAITGEVIDRKAWKLDYPLEPDGYPPPQNEIPSAKRRSAWWNCCFQIKHHAQEPGQGIHSHTDRDAWSAVGLDGWVGLIYLNKKPDLESGLTTWKNRNPQRQFAHMTSAKNWHQIDYFSNTYNRLILLRGAIPHSGGSGWGSNFKSGRLFQTLFFRTKTVKIKPLSCRDLGLK